MSPARNFCQRTTFTFCTEQPVVTGERIRLQDTPEWAEVLPISANLRVVVLRLI
ncbi:hypothetical protein AB93_4483 [Escherichia coli 5-172-05_S3_C1]|nr:hypothetical protein AC56_5577 [Escherichia coli 1-182-04_S3_C3]EZK07696.1 hypothetical protein AB99_5075 [Escherichia coli 1-182-04_S3_C1]KEL05920.1 hypothetical protein AD19_4474 [Escherichia coli 4-203-08_S4_C2]KEL47216.1 hypothetical protein AB93_4483 [Escherichia coli 5-172-05_S3_C1]